MFVKAVFIQQGMMIGEVSKEIFVDTVVLKNPVLVIVKQNELVFAPFLQLVDEKEVTISLSEVTFKKMFTPKQEIINRYNQIFGSGIVVANPNALNF